MITTIRKRQRWWNRAGFTLAEVMVAAGLGSFLLSGVLSAFMMLVRSEANAYHYVGMEQEARRGLERFSEDVRMANGITWTDNTHVALTIPRTSGTGTDTVVYYYDTTSGSSTCLCFVRQGPDPSSGTVTTQALVHNVNTFEFSRWMLGSTGEATNDYGTKQLQIRLTLRRASNTAVAASNLVVSARYILRNKIS